MQYKFIRVNERHFIRVDEIIGVSVKTDKATNKHYVVYDLNDGTEVPGEGFENWDDAIKDLVSTAKLIEKYLKS